ncbi:uncharacterized protein LOC131207055 [Anopheles bellator]|uniref:uncharacterized protein LOC131207055 n=1 Tax=Anopheles bellator TaxID=139047 RepID=UPI002647FDB7|nr:uncharacterized protein LOC131207055 [Anopheles bellator]
MAEPASEPKPIVAPEWLNASFFESILCTSEHDKDLRVTGLEATPVGKPGDHLASQPFRFTVDYESVKRDAGHGGTMKLVVKILPERGVIGGQGTLDQELFRTELKMYGEFLPKMQRVLDDGDRPVLLARCLHSAEKPLPVIVMEDLAPAGWQGHDLIESFAEAKPITVAIARFHAASFYLSKNKTDFEGFQSDVFQRKDPVVEWMFGKNLKAFVDAMRTWEGCEQLVEPLERTVEDCSERLHRIYCCHTPGRAYNVLNHGDFHSKNLLHRFNDENAIVESRFLDLQACCWSSPAIDLYYLLNTIVHYKVKASHRDDLISLYHQEFTATLKAIGYFGAVPTMLDLQTELLRNAYLDLLHVTCFLQFRFIDFSKIPPEKLAPEQIGNVGLENEDYQALVKQLLPGYLHKGVLE